MKREIEEFKNMLDDLWAISESPNFSDTMRNEASRFFHFIKSHKPAPTEPSHEEIMTKRWLNNNNDWVKVINYSACHYKMSDNIRQKSWFTGRQSSDCPPEG